MDFSPEVAEARSAKKPIVALESTIITHGMPYPRNVETARSVEEAVREMGAVPATIAVIDGRLRVGLDARRDRAARPALGRRGESLAARSGAGRRAQGLGGHDGRGDDVHRLARGHRNLRHRRHRRRASRRRGDVRHLRRSGRAFAHPRRRRVRRREIDPRHRQDPRIPGDPGGRGRRLPHRRVPRLLRPLLRLQARASLRRASRSRPHDPPPARHRPRRAPDRQSDSRRITRSKRRRSRGASPKRWRKPRRKGWARRRRRRSC